MLLCSALCGGAKREEEDLLPDLILDLSDNNVINSSKTTNNKFIALSLNCIIMILIAIATATVAATATAIATRRANQLLFLLRLHLSLYTFFSFNLSCHAHLFRILAILRLSNGPSLSTGNSIFIIWKTF